MVLTTVLLAVSTVAVPVENGTWSPTCKVAAWLSSTTSDGLDSTLTSVTLCSASRMTRGEFSASDQEIEAGKHASEQRAGGGVDGIAGGFDRRCCWAPTPGIVLEIEPFWLARKNCTP